MLPDDNLSDFSSATILWHESEGNFTGHDLSIYKLWLKLPCLKSEPLLLEASELK